MQYMYVQDSIVLKLLKAIYFELKDCSRKSYSSQVWSGQ